MSVVRRLVRLSPPVVTRGVKKLVPPRFYHLVDPDWHRAAVGGFWDEIGKLQFEFLLGQGLRPDHYLLDVGCGSLRGGVHFIRYLEPGHYYGIDVNEATLEAGRRVELARAGLEHKRPVLRVLADFEVETLERAFDYALAQSLFTHIPLEAITTCVRNVDRVLVPGGRLYATFVERPPGATTYVPADASSPFYKEPGFRYEADELAATAEGTSLTFRYHGDWSHPRKQSMVVFEKRA